MPVTPQALTLNPLKDATKVDEIDYSADFDNLFSKMDDFNKFFRNVKISDMLKYIPRLTKAVYQGQLEKTETKTKYADDSYKGKKVVEFTIQLAGNQYTNFHNIYLCFPIKIKPAADNDNDIAAGYIPVNNFFAHRIKEIHIKSCGDDIPILPLSKIVVIYRYSDKILKYMPKKALKIRITLLYSKKKVRIYGNENDICAHRTTTNATDPDGTDENLTERIEKFQDQIKSEFVYRIPLRFLCNIGLANQCFKFNTKYILTLETDMQRLFETNVNQAADALPRIFDAEIIFTSAPCIMYEQLKLDNN